MTLFKLIGFLFFTGIWGLPLYGAPNSCESILPTNFDGLKNIIQDCKMKSVEDVLNSFHDDAFYAPTLIYGSRSLQGATPTNPRVLLHLGNLTLAYNGSSDQRGFFDLETVEFNEGTSHFEFRSINFPKVKSESVTFSETNPSKCLSCHGQDPRPNWSSYVFWPGFYAGEDNELSPAEIPLYKRFLANKKLSKRYSRIDDATLAPGSHWEPLFYFGHYFTIENNLRITRKIKEDQRLRPYFYAILAAATCSDEKTDVRQFLSEEARKNFVLDYNQIYKSTIEANEKMADHDRQFQKKVKGADIQNKRVLETYKNGSIYQNGEASIMAGLRYLVEGLGGQTADWSMEFGFKSYRFEDGLGGLLRLKFYLKDLLDPVKDKELYQLYKSFSLGNQEYDWNEKSKERACAILKRKSLSL